MPEKAKHYGITTKLDQEVDPAEGLVLQYELKLSEGLTCGGAYLKYLTATPDFSPADLTDGTPYSIMFGPDKCGATNKVRCAQLSSQSQACLRFVGDYTLCRALPCCCPVCFAAIISAFTACVDKHLESLRVARTDPACLHPQVHLILRHKAPNGTIEEKHLKFPPSVELDKGTHVYTAILYPSNNSYVPRADLAPQVCYASNPALLETPSSPLLLELQSELGLTCV